MTTPSHSQGSNGYALLLGDLKERIRSARLRAALAVNQELILLYWSVGRDILARQVDEGWSTRVIDRLSADLRRDFPEMTGLSARNLKYMRAFAEAHPEQEVVQQVVAQLPWGHNVRLLDVARQSKPCASDNQRHIHWWNISEAGSRLSSSKPPSAVA